MNVTPACAQSLNCRCASDARRFALHLFSTRRTCRGTMASPQAGRYAPASADTAVPAGLSALIPAMWSEFGASCLRPRCHALSRTDRGRAARSIGAGICIKVCAFLRSDTLRIGVACGRNRQSSSGHRYDHQISPHGASSFFFAVVHGSKSLCILQRRNRLEAPAHMHVVGHGRGSTTT
jgi:hypothetical protein